MEEATGEVRSDLDGGSFCHVEEVIVFCIVLGSCDSRYGEGFTNCLNEYMTYS